MRKQKPQAVDLSPTEIAAVSVAEKRAREIMRTPDALDVPLWSLLASTYLQGIRDVVEAGADMPAEPDGDAKPAGGGA